MTIALCRSSLTGGAQEEGPDPVTKESVQGIAPLVDVMIGRIRMILSQEGVSTVVVSSWEGIWDVRSFAKEQVMDIQAGRLKIVIDGVNLSHAMPLCAILRDISMILRVPGWLVLRGCTFDKGTSLRGIDLRGV